MTERGRVSVVEEGAAMTCIKGGYDGWRRADDRA